MRRLLTDSAIYGTLGTVSRFVGVLLIPIYTRVFAPPEYGKLDLLVTATAVLVLLSGLQVESGVARSYYEARDAGRERELLGTSLLLYLIGVAVWTCLAVAIFGLGLNGLEGIAWADILPLVLALLPMQMLGLFQVLLRLERRPYLFGLLSIGDVVTSALLSLVLVVWLRQGVVGALWGLLLSKVIWAAVGGKLLASQFALAWDGQHAREILVYGVPLVPNTVIGWAQNSASRFVLAATLTLFQVGLFSLAVKIASVPLLVGTAFRMAWMPYALEIMGKPGSRETYAQVLDYYLLGMFGLCALLGAWNSLAIHILSSAEFGGAGRVVGFLAMGYLWNGALQILGVGTWMVRKTYLNIIGTALGAAVNLLVLGLTAPRWGLAAAGLTYLLGTHITALVILQVAQRQYRIPYRYWTVGLMSIATWLTPMLFYFMPQPVSWNEMVFDAALKTLIVLAVWGACAAALVRPGDRRRLLRAARLKLKGAQS